MNGSLDKILKVTAEMRAAVDSGVKFESSYHDVDVTKLLDAIDSMSGAIDLCISYLEKQHEAPVRNTLKQLLALTAKSLEGDK